MLVKGDYNRMVAKQKANIKRLKAVKTNLLIYKGEIDHFAYKVSESEKKWLTKIKQTIKDIEEIQEL